MIKKSEIILLESMANVQIDYDENNDTYTLSLSGYEIKEHEHEEGEGDPVTHYGIKSTTKVFLEKGDVEEIIKLLNYSIS